MGEGKVKCQNFGCAHSSTRTTTPKVPASTTSARRSSTTVIRAGLAARARRPWTGTASRSCRLVPSVAALRHTAKGAGERNRPACPVRQYLRSPSRTTTRTRGKERRRAPRPSRAHRHEGQAQGNKIRRRDVPVPEQGLPGAVPAGGQPRQALHVPVWNYCGDLCDTPTPPVAETTQVVGKPTT